MHVCMYVYTYTYIYIYTHMHMGLSDWLRPAFVGSFSAVPQMGHAKRGSNRHIAKKSLQVTFESLQSDLFLDPPFRIPFWGDSDAQVRAHDDRASC